MITKNIGGKTEMTARYYLKNGRVYPTYNRGYFRSSKPIRALREAEVKQAIFRVKLLRLVVSVLAINIIVLGSYLVIANSQRQRKMIEMEEIAKYYQSQKEIIQTIPINSFVFEDDIIEEESTQEDISMIDLVHHQQNSTDGNITIGDTTFVKMDLPNKYYKYIDFSSFQPYMPYDTITNKKSQAYQICYSEHAYTDADGMRRYEVTDDQFSIDGIDDYIVAMGTFYKTHGVAGERFLIETTEGSFTVITGDEKSDLHTDSKNMFTTHGGKAGIIEWIVDDSKIEEAVKKGGTVTKGSLEFLKGEIINIYKIEEGEGV